MVKVEYSGFKWLSKWKKVDLNDLKRNIEYLSGI